MPLCSTGQKWSLSPCPIHYGTPCGSFPNPWLLNWNKHNWQMETFPQGLPDSRTEDNSKQKGQKEAPPSTVPSILWHIIIIKSLGTSLITSLSPKTSCWSTALMTSCWGIGSSKYFTTGWAINPRKIQGPNTSVKFLGIRGLRPIEMLCLKREMTCCTSTILPLRKKHNAWWASSWRWHTPLGCYTEPFPHLDERITAEASEIWGKK